MQSAKDLHKKAWIILLMAVLFAITAYKIISLQVKEEIYEQETIKITIYGIDTCYYCLNAKRLLDNNNIPYEYIDITDKNILRHKLVTETNQRTVPYVYINDKFKGGFSDIKIVISNLK